MSALSPWRRYKFITVGALFLLGMLFSIVQVVLEDVDGAAMKINICDGVTFGVGAWLWCSFDSAERSLRVTYGYRILALLVPIVGFPAYAFKTRGRRGFVLVGWGLLLVVLVQAVNFGVCVVGVFVRGFFYASPGA
jgi:hypothetical protein